VRKSLLTSAALAAVFAIGCGGTFAERGSQPPYTIKVYSAGNLVETYPHASKPFTWQSGATEFYTYDNQLVMLGPGTEFVAVPER
jgi:hypothetical protein